jgi:hypothetical protein
MYQTVKSVSRIQDRENENELVYGGQIIQKSALSGDRAISNQKSGVISQSSHFRSPSQALGASNSDAGPKVSVSLKLKTGQNQAT